MLKFKNKEALRLPVVIFCGGKGTRAGSISSEIPKPLLKIGGRPVLWHVMKIYASWGFKSFILCLGHKGVQIKRYFKIHNSEKWRIDFVDTGISATKAQRLIKVRHLIKNDNFFLAYGDDVANIDLNRLLRFHLKHKTIVTITAVRVISDFGIIDIGKDSRISRFREKPCLNEWMNGGFMVINKDIFGFLKSGELEKEVFGDLVKNGQLSAYRHQGNWKAMNTLKDNIELNALWREGKAFWKAW